MIRCMTVPVLLLASMLTACGNKAEEADSSATTADGTTGAAADGCGTVHDVTTTDETADMAAYMDFSPEDLTIAAGDCVRFIMSQTHNAVEVSEESYTSRDGTALDGGFNVTYGETAVVEFDTAGVHYYVCQPHVLGDMVGTITVQ